MQQEHDIEIKFGQSASKNYRRAINLAKKLPGFKQADEVEKFNSIVLSASQVYSNGQIFSELFHIIISWKATSISYKGKPTKSFAFIHDLNQVFRCYDNYKASLMESNYCKKSNIEEGWACNKISSIMRHMAGSYYYSTYWYRFGSFTSPGIWAIDKVQIRKILRAEIEQKLLHHCPVFPETRLEEILDCLPEEIDVTNNKNWEIEYQNDFTGTQIQKIAVNIIHSEQREDFNGVDELENEIPDEDQEDREYEYTEEPRKRNIPKITFGEIGGVDPIIDQIREVVELPLKFPEIYKHLGIKPHKGILLYGSPGNGKTMIAKAIANEVKAHFIPVSGPELISKWHGLSEENLRAVFAEARRLQPSIIFFDEIDSVAQSRTGDESSRVDAKFVNQLLTLMDGMESYDNVSILASTNRPELLDHALLRPGRFDYKIEIQNPDEIGCYQILKVATKYVPLDDNFSINTVVPALVGYSGAEIVFVVKEAAIQALKRCVDVKMLILSEMNSNLNIENIRVGQSDFEIAMEKLRNNSLSLINQ